LTRSAKGKQVTGNDEDTALRLLNVALSRSRGKPWLAHAASSGNGIRTAPAVLRLLAGLADRLTEYGNLTTGADGT
jgi:hypothetical protein